MTYTLRQLWDAKQIAVMHLNDHDWQHSYHVMVSVGDDIRRMILAILHDVLESTNKRQSVIDKIRAATDQSIIDDLLLLTHDEDVRYRVYIQTIAESGRADAIAVKIKDLEHNMDLTRLDKVEQYHLDRHNKYKKAHRILSEALKNVTSTV